MPRSTDTPLASMGDMGSVVLPPSKNATKWTAGTSVRVAWGMRYNHGGGLSPPPLRFHAMTAPPLMCSLSNRMMLNCALVGSCWLNFCALAAGYQYRLCPADQPLTEDCFQQMPLDL